MCATSVCGVGTWFDSGHQVCLRCSGVCVLLRCWRRGWHLPRRLCKPLRASPRAPERAVREPGDVESSKQQPGGHTSSPARRVACSPHARPDRHRAAGDRRGLRRQARHISGCAPGRSAGRPECLIACSPLRRRCCARALTLSVVQPRCARAAATAPWLADQRFYLAHQHSLFSQLQPARAFAAPRADLLRTARHSAA